jgi:hypothetical protein
LLPLTHRAGTCAFDGSADRAGCWLPEEQKGTRSSRAARLHAVAPPKPALSRVVSATEDQPVVAPAVRLMSALRAPGRHPIVSQMVEIDMVAPWAAPPSVVLSALLSCLGLFAGCKSHAATTERAPIAGGYTVRSVHFEVWREPDGKQRPNQMNEGYDLQADGTLSYSAYFGGMPTQMNHVDGIEWNSGGHGKKMLGVVRALLADPVRRGELKRLPDDSPSPPFTDKHYLVGLTKNGADSTWYVKDAKTRAFREIDQAFASLIAAFEKATGRPRKPTDLPQRPANP